VIGTRQALNMPKPQYIKQIEIPIHHRKKHLKLTPEH